MHTARNTLRTTTNINPSVSTMGVDLVRGEETGWRKPLLTAAVVVVAVRVVLSIWAAFVLNSMPTPDLQAQYAHSGVPLQSSGVAAPWQREDALWYENIATNGYAPEDGTTVFLPLLPALMRVGSIFTLGNVALAGIIISSLLAIIALALLYKLTALDLGAGVGVRALLYMALFPTAFFLYSAYTESLFLALALGAFWCARQKKWAVCALLAGLAGAAKVQGAFLCLPLAFEYLSALNWKLPALRKRLVEFAGVIVTGPLALLMFFAAMKFAVGDPLLWTDRESAMWHHRVAWPGETLFTAVQTILTEHQITINTFDLIIALLFTVLAIASFRLRPSYGLQSLTIIALPWLHIAPEFPLMSFSRYVLSAFGCFIVLAAWISRRPRIIHLLFIALSISLLLVWSSQFVRGYWVG